MGFNIKNLKCNNIIFYFLLIIIILSGGILLNKYFFNKENFGGFGSKDNDDDDDSDTLIDCSQENDEGNCQLENQITSAEKYLKSLPTSEGYDSIDRKKKEELINKSYMLIKKIRKSQAISNFSSLKKI
jgi:hypothetical protein